MLVGSPRTRTGAGAGQATAGAGGTGGALMRSWDESMVTRHTNNPVVGRHAVDSAQGNYRAISKELDNVNLENMGTAQRETLFRNIDERMRFDKIQAGAGAAGPEAGRLMRDHGPSAAIRGSRTTGELKSTLGNIVSQPRYRGAVERTGGMAWTDYMYGYRAPQIGAGIAGTGFLVQQMSGRRGRQSNAELYNQGQHGVGGPMY